MNGKIPAGGWQVSLLVGGCLSGMVAAFFYAELYELSDDTDELSQLSNKQIQGISTICVLFWVLALGIIKLQRNRQAAAKGKQE